MMGEDYSYARTNFRGYPNITLPKDDQWDDRGKKYATFVMLLFYKIQCLNIGKMPPILSSEILNQCEQRLFP